MKKWGVAVLVGLQFLAMSYVAMMAWSAVSWRGGEDWASLGAVIIGMPLAFVQCLVCGAVFSATEPTDAQGRYLRRASLVLAITAALAAVIGWIDP